MDGYILLALAAVMALAAVLYSSVGHGGASAYLALMALFSLSPLVMRPTALALNLLVSSIASYGYIRAGQFNWRLFLSFAATAIPFAFVGGAITLPADLYRPLVGAILWIAAVRLAWNPAAAAAREVVPPRLWISLPAGAAIGLLAGLTGTGGGIFLSPLILLFRWEEPRRTSGVAAAFILANSAAGLAGASASLKELPSDLPILLIAVGIGGLIGVGLGVKRLPRSALLRLLAVILGIAGAKLMFS